MSALLHGVENKTPYNINNIITVQCLVQSLHMTSQITCCKPRSHKHHKLSSLLIKETPKLIGMYHIIIYYNYVQYTPNNRI